MMRYLDKLNLRPGEKRLVVAVVLAAFIVIQIVFVWPHFGDVGNAQVALVGARAKLEKSQTEVNKSGQYQKKLRELEGAGSSVPTQEAALNLQNIVQQQAAASGVAILSYDSRTSSGQSKTSEFFDEYQLRIQINSGDKELVDFLYKLGSGSSLIRVRDLTLNPDPSQTRLNGTIALVASYQKPPATRRGATTAAAAAPKP